MPTVIALYSLILALVAFFLGIEHSPKWYFVSAFAMYIFSFMTGFSIGRYMLNVTFSLLALALAHLLVKTRQKFWSLLLSAVSMIIGFSVWALISMFVQFSVMFWPIDILLRQLGL